MHPFLVGAGAMQPFLVGAGATQPFWVGAEVMQPFLVGVGAGFLLQLWFRLQLQKQLLFKDFKLYVGSQYVIFDKLSYEVGHTLHMSNSDLQKSRVERWSRLWFPTMLTIKVSRSSSTS